MNAPAEPLRRVAQERGRILGELGVRLEDVSWTRAEAETIGSLLTPSRRLRLPRAIQGLLRKLERVMR